MSNYKIFQIKLPTPLFEEFYKTFPGRGERKLLVESFISMAVELSDKKNCFIEGVLQEAHLRYEEKED